MNYNFQKPENAIIRANELIKVGEIRNAANALSSIFTSGRHKNWTAVHEVVMKKLLGICFDLRDDSMVKEAFTQYRNICQNSNTPSSMLIVVNEFVEKIYLKIKSVMGNPMTVTQADNWIQFLYETMRNTLESLKNNGPMQVIYHQLCRDAFKYCVDYNRPKEFRRLYDLLSSHLKFIRVKVVTSTEVNNYSEKYRVNWNYQTAFEQLETRFFVLDKALESKCYEVCFMIIQDVYSIMDEVDQVLIKTDKKMKNLPLQVLKPSFISSYYDKLSQVFWVSKNYLYHAFSKLKYFQLHKSHSKKFNEKKEEVSSIVLLAALSIPLVNRSDGNDYQYSSLLNLKETIPTRETLLKEIAAIKIPRDAVPEFRQLYELLEIDLHPLTLVQQSKKAINIIHNSDVYSQYETPIKILILQKLLNQLSTIYTTMKIPHFFNLVKDLNLSEFTVERIMIASIKSGHIHVRIDHKNECLLFNNGDSLESNDMKTQLQVLCNRLENVVKHIYPNNEQKLEVSVDEMRKSLDAEYKAAIARKELIEFNKQRTENDDLERQKHREEELRREEEELKAKEKQRRITEQRQREIEKMEKEKKEEQLRLLQDAAKRLGKTGPFHISDVDDAQYAKMIQESEEKDRKLMIDIQKRREENAKRLDYITRAIRETEAPLLLAKVEKDKRDAYSYIEQEYENYKHKVDTYIKNNTIYKEIIPIIEPQIQEYEDIIIKSRCEAIREELENRQKEDLAAKKAESEKRRIEEEERNKELEKKELENNKRTYQPPQRREQGPPFQNRNTFSSSTYMSRNTGSGSVGLGSSSSGSKYIPPSRR